MLRSIAQDIRHQFQSGNTITRLIIVNVAVFLLLMLFLLGIRMSTGFEPDNTAFGDTVRYLFLRQDPLWDVKHPWVILTYMFTHTGFIHLLFNMLVLYWFGRIAGDLLGDHRMLPLYLYSGLAGALIYLLTAPLLYTSSTLNGASAAVLGIVAAAGITAPDYQMRLLFLGDVRLKYIVLGLIVLDLVAIANMGNMGGHLAHLGGAAFGFFYVHMLRQGNDLTAGFRRLAGLFRRSPRRPAQPVRRKVPMTIRHRSARAATDSAIPPVPHFEGDQERLDAILDKIKRSGMHSLSDEEKKFLHDASQK